MRKARAWLESKGAAYQFHDFKKLGVPSSSLSLWLQAIGRDELINRRGTTWRGLDVALREGMTSDAHAHRLLSAHPSAITRPVVSWGSASEPCFTAGFDASGWEKRLALSID